MRYAEFYASSPHPRRRAETRRIEDLHLTRIRQGAHGFDDPATEELVVGVVLGGVTRCRWTWGDGWNETARRRAGDIGLTPPRSGGTFEVDGDHELLVIGFPLAAMAERGLVEDSCARPFGRLHDAYHRDPAAFRQCLRLWALAGRGNDAAAMESATITSALLDAWRDRAGRPVPTPRPVRPLDDAAFATIAAMVQDEPGDRHRLEAWAAVAGLSASAFCRAFKARTGLSPHQYLLDRRISLAERWLADHGIDETADRLGFDSRAHFTRVFTRLRGHSPRS